MTPDCLCPGSDLHEGFVYFHQLRITFLDSLFFTSLLLTGVGIIRSL
jgi:hypothetical protein